MIIGLEDSLNLISEEIIDTGLILKDLCYIISEYAINPYVIGRFQNNPDELYNNYVYMSVEDYNPDILYLKIKYDIFSVKCHPDVKKGRINFNDTQKQFLNAPLYITICVVFSNSGFRVNNLLKLKIKIDKSLTELKTDIESIINIFKNTYKSQILTWQQLISMKYKDIYLTFKVTRITTEGKKHKYEIASDFNGRLTDDTEIIVI
jgi:hypothetical protein